MRFAFLAFGTAVALLGLGGGMLAVSITDYLDSPRTLSSTSGLAVFEVDGVLVQYAPFETGQEVTVLGAGFVVLVASLVLAAIVWRPRLIRV
ncbi:putative membrane protein YfcA [Leifsonia sp. AK011]|uniref:hypothetical protein n=1 Tax=Leifsonia sp. AK011 TaxID=2723075 RepID=UPI0015CB2D19|nr:hypothetical protein [Leifsonia sp. AK011]NYF09580.1 putative membrane protein YfcA [Leifsonia sp. AK011]